MDERQFGGQRKDRRLTVNHEFRGLDQFIMEYVQNISKSGVFIKSDDPLPVGTEFLFRLVIPKLPEPVELKGTVVWINSREEKARPEIEELGMGIRFVYRDDEQRNQFMQMVEKMMRESLGDLLFSKLMEQESD